MKEDLLNILSNNNNKDIDNTRLMAYLNGQLSDEDRHHFEQQMLESELMNDAVEGLEGFQNKSQINSLTDELNQSLLRKLGKKNTARTRRKMKEIPIMYASIIVVFIIIMIAFFLIWKHYNS